MGSDWAARWVKLEMTGRIDPFFFGLEPIQLARPAPGEGTSHIAIQLPKMKRRKMLAGPAFSEWRRQEKIESLLSRRAGVRDCPCGGSNENCFLCNGLGVITSTPNTAPLGTPKSDLRVCDKCEFRGSAAELEAHRMQHHSTELKRCVRCGFEGSTAELEAHMPSRNGFAVPVTLE